MCVTLPADGSESAPNQIRRTAYKSITTTAQEKKSISMGKQKQQVISRFFAPKSNQTTASSSSSPPPPPQQQTPPPKIAATVSFSPAKRKVVSSLFAQKTPKRPKLSPHTLNPIPTPSSQTAHHKKYTPLEQQVVELKTKYPDVLLMIEVGYKFRFFGEDAEIAAKVLGIYAHLDHNFMTASIPTFRLNVHVRRLVNAGFKVGVVKQTETAAIKAHGPGKAGPFGRGLSALYTKATLEAAEDVGGGEDGCGGESNYLVCVVDDDGNVGKIRNGVFGDGFDARIGVVAVEISTGDVVYGEFNDGFLRSGLEAVLLSLSPAELLLSQPLNKQTEKLLLAYAGPASNVRVEHVSRDCFIGGGALAEVMSLYENMSEDTLSNNEDQNMDVLEQGNHRSAIEGVMNMPDLAVQALALTIRHLKQFGLERIMCVGASFRSLSGSMEMTLSANTLQQLEVLRNNSNGSEYGSLLHIMNHTLTIYGSRLLRRWVTHPLCDRNLISARLGAVSEIAESMGSYKTSESLGQHDEKNSDVTIVEPQFYYILSSVLTSLGRAPDIQRGITRIFHRTATPSEFIAVMQTVLYAGKQLQQLHIDEEYKEKVASKTLHSVLLKRLILTASSPAVIGKAAKLLSMVNKEAADQGDLSNLMIISNGQFSEIARARKAVQSAKEELDSLINMCCKQLGMRNLEFMSVSGITHLIELPANFKVPLNWVKVNSTKKMIRYHSPEVLSALDQLALANEELTIVCRAAWDSFLKEFGGYYAEFQAAVQALAALDCLHALAILSRNKNFVQPVFVDDHEPVQIHICSGRHPVLDTILLDNFVPNNTNLHAEREFCQIITGPNMGGKSCYIRQVALIAIMAQVGSFVPASSAKLHVLDGVYTRMGASDSIQQGRSTFLEELNEASCILRNCTAQSLVIVDELGRGTSTHDGVAIAYATLDYLLEHKKCMVLFVTHYPKIADIKTKFTGSVGTYHVSYLTSHRFTGPMDSKSDQDVTYLYKVVPGVSESSFGFKVAQLAQLPPSCISRATVIAAKLEAEVSSRVQNRSAKRELLVKLSDQEQEAQENMHVSPDSFYSRRVEASEDLISAYRDLFLNLRFATNDDNPAKSFQFLKHARSIAKELIIR